MAREYSNRGNNSRTTTRKKNNASKRTAQPAKKRSAPKKNTRRKTRTPTGTPGWVWLGSGLCIGLTVAAVVYIASRPTGEPNREPTAEQSIATPSSTAAESDSASTATAEDEQAASDQQGDNPRFAFYEMLPDYKVVIPEESYPGKTPSGTGSTTASSTNNSQPAPEPSKPQPTPPSVSKPGRYIIQAGSFSTPKDANRRKAELTLLGL